MAEAVRLVIWDLDETFWSGTLTEGGHSYNYQNHEIVIRLAERGIMSSICSKNDHQAVETILRGTGIWDYFIFPSINWDSKGPRIRQMIETIGLRPPTVMLIDDNPMNLNEALHFVPEIQVAAQTIIPEILSSPIFAGKEDLGLTRLAQYKVLERKCVDQISAGEDNRAFLRASNIRVHVEHDIENNVDRVIELVNRTNQLNFTKVRLSENPAKARAELTAMLSGFMIQTGLVHVQDRYGDYGYCGFYAVNALSNQMLHFCFSCRILNMGVEKWLYDKLGRPNLNVVGDVLTDLFTISTPVDWINLEIKAAEGLGAKVAPEFGLALLRGGCELQVIMHYLSLATREVSGEFFATRFGMAVRIDHSMFLRYAFEGIAPEAVTALAPLGYIPSDFQSRVIADGFAADFFLFSFWQNATHALYRHKTLGCEILFSVPATDNSLNLFEIPSAVLDERLTEPFAREAVEYLRQNFDWVGVEAVSALQNDVRSRISFLPTTKPIFILLQLENWTNRDGSVQPIHHHIRTNDALREACGTAANVFLIRIEDHISEQSEIIDGIHFKRQVYHRISNEICERVSIFSSATTLPRADKEREEFMVSE